MRVAIISSQSVDQCGVGSSSRHIGSHVQEHKDDSDRGFDACHGLLLNVFRVILSL